MSVSLTRLALVTFHGCREEQTQYFLNIFPRGWSQIAAASQKACVASSSPPTSVSCHILTIYRCYIKLLLNSED